MGLIQSILFFVLGAAVSAFILALFLPLAWRRALHFARKEVRSQVPLSLDEVEAAHDVARAAHALEACRWEERLRVAKEREMAARLTADRAREQLVYLAPFEAEAAILQQEIKSQAAEITALKEESEALHYKIRVMETRAARDAGHLLKLKTRNRKIALLRREKSGLRRMRERLERNNADLQKALKEKQAALEKVLADLTKRDLMPLRREMKETTARIVATIALEEGENSPIMELVKEEGEDLAPSDGSLAGAIRQAIAQKIQLKEQA